jgi:hypothetical protein
MSNRPIFYYSITQGCFLRMAAAIFSASCCRSRSELHGDNKGCSADNHFCLAPPQQEFRRQSASGLGTRASRERSHIRIVRQGNTYYRPSCDGESESSDGTRQVCHHAWAVILATRCAASHRPRTARDREGKCRFPQSATPCKRTPPQRAPVSGRGREPWRWIDVVVLVEALQPRPVACPSELRCCPQRQ